MTFDPASGKLIAVVQGNPGGRRLVAIDPATAVATSVGLVSDNFASIDFGPDPSTPVPLGPFSAAAIAILLLASG